MISPGGVCLPLEALGKVESPFQGEVTKSN